MNRFWKLLRSLGAGMERLVTLLLWHAVKLALIVAVIGTIDRFQVSMFDPQISATTQQMSFLMVVAVVAFLLVVAYRVDHSSH